MGSKYANGLVVGADLGGTKILAGVVTPEGEIIGTAKRATKPKEGVEKVIDRMAKTIDDAVADAKVKREDILAIASGTPGPLDPDKGIVHNAPNLTGWENVPIARLFSGM